MSTSTGSTTLTTSKLSAGQKGFVPLLIILLVAALVGGYVLYSKQKSSTPPSQPIPQVSSSASASPIDTSNWKTYTNENFGITLKYPSFYSLEEKFTPVKSGQPTFIVSNAFNFDKTKLPICNESESVKPCLKQFKGSEIQSIALNGKKAISFTVIVPMQDGSQGDILHVAQTAEGKHVEIALSIAGMGGEETFQQILSTFKFLP